MPVLGIFICCSAISCAVVLIARWVSIVSLWWHPISYRDHAERHGKMINIAKIMTRPISWPVMWTFDASFVFSLNKLLGRGAGDFETSRRWCDVTVMICPIMSNQYNLSCDGKVSELRIFGTNPLPIWSFIKSLRVTWGLFCPFPPPAPPSSSPPPPPPFCQHFSTFREKLWS